MDSYLTKSLELDALLKRHFERISGNHRSAESRLWDAKKLIATLEQHISNITLELEKERALSISLQSKVQNASKRERYLISQVEQEKSEAQRWMKDRSTDFEHWEQTLFAKLKEVEERELLLSQGQRSNDNNISCGPYRHQRLQACGLEEATERVHIIENQLQNRENIMNHFFTFWHTFAHDSILHVNALQNENHLHMELLALKEQEFLVRTRREDDRLRDEIDKLKLDKKEFALDCQAILRNIRCLSQEQSADDSQQHITERVQSLLRPT